MLLLALHAQYLSAKLPVRTALCCVVFCLFLPDQVEQVVSQLRSGRLALPAVDWLHLSPPCQNVSQKKKLDHRVLSGEELR
jgi:hypothetical protein